MDRRHFLRLAAGAATAAAVAPLAAFSKAGRGESTLCPRCRVGRDTDGDGDCAFCARLPIDVSRTVERLVADGWSRVGFEELKPGDICRMREPDGSLVDQGTAFEVFMVEEEAKLVRMGDFLTWQIKTQRQGWVRET